MKKARKRFAMASVAGVVTASAVLSYCHASGGEPSVCFGSPNAGALSDGWRLPRRGPNFRVYSDLGWGLGRTYVHSSVHAVVLDAYAALRASQPQQLFIYGETGLLRGGKFSPHHSHQNGLSVDFMVPVLDANAKPAALPTSSTDKFGYGVDFDRAGKTAEFSIDFEAMAAHLLALKTAAASRKVGIARVIFAPDLQPHLRRAKLWSQIRDLAFSPKPSWVRHDDHYHVDFSVGCKPASDAN